jgi:hypothetical protein
MYELKKIRKVLTSKSVGPDPRLMKKEFTGPRSHKGWETMPYDATLTRITEDIVLKYIRDLTCGISSRTLS